MKSVFLLLAVIACSQANYFIDQDILNEEWKVFKLEHAKEYENEIEERNRFEVFKETKLFIAQHNQKFEAGLETYELGLNQFADMLEHEVNELMNGFNATYTNIKTASQYAATFITPANLKAPGTMDWRTVGAVTGVKNQGHCGSCWAFSATGALEGQHFRKTHQLVSLSEQNLVDCSGAYGNHGCHGGIMPAAFQYIKVNKGIDTEPSYPYVGHDDRCHFNRRTVGATDTGFVIIPQFSEQKLMEAVASVGPVSIAIDAGKRSFQMYKSGVYNDPACSSTKLNHGVLAIGYGTEGNRQQYWLVKNSWGAAWGDRGYIKIARNAGNRCGVATYASYPTV